MAILVVAVLAFLTTGCACQIWTAQNASSVWDCQTVRKHVNITLTTETYNVASLVGCAHQCANTTPSSPQTGVDFLSLYFDVDARRCYCSPDVDVDNPAEDETQPEIKYCRLNFTLKMDKTADQYTRRLLWPYHHDCSSLHDFYTRHINRSSFYEERKYKELELLLKQNVLTKEGVYAIYPDGEGPVNVWCDMDDAGHTVIQRRLGGEENFNRNWSEYVNGFGDTTGEYWLGLKYMHLLTTVDLRLLIRLEPSDERESQNAWHALQYYRFTVGNASSNYAFQHRAWFGFTPDHAYDVPDILHGHRNISFSTADNDNDDSEQNLAAETQSGWWIEGLPEGNLNIPYAERGDNSSTTKKKLFYWPACKSLSGLNVIKTTMRVLQYDYIPRVPDYLHCRISN